MKLRLTDPSIQTAMVDFPVSPSPFTIHVPDDVLDDLRWRLQHARVVPDNVGAGLHDPNGAWAYGTDRDTLKDYVSFDSDLRHASCAWHLLAR